MMSETTAEDQIRLTAYYIWLEDGQPHGRAEQHWMTARALIEGQTAKSDVTAALKDVDRGD